MEGHGGPLPVAQCQGEVSGRAGRYRWASVGLDAPLNAMTPCAARGIENVGPVGRNRGLHHPGPVAAGRSGLGEFSIHARGQYVAVAQHRLDGARYGFVEHTVGREDGRLARGRPHGPQAQAIPQPRRVWRNRAWRSQTTPSPSPSRTMTSVSSCLERSCFWSLAAKMTAEERSEAARKAAEARWKRPSSRRPEQA